MPTNSKGDGLPAGMPVVDRTPKMYIGGKQVRPDGNYTRAVIGRKGEIVGQVGDGNRKDIRDAVEAAHAAHTAKPGWAMRHGYNRSQILYFIAENLDARREEFARRITALTGQSLKSAQHEVELTVERLFTYAAWADKYGGSVQETTLRGVTVALNEPVGVVGITCPDEYPLLAFVSLITYYDPTNGNGTARNLSGQTRAVAWCQRTIGQLAGIGPSGDAVVAEYVSLLSSNVNPWNTERQRAGQNLLGYLYSYELPSGGYGTGVASPWQQHFWVQSYGHISDLEPFPDMTNLNALRGHLYKSAVGILGANGTDNYCFTRASEYAITIASSNDPDATNWYDSWGTVFQATTGSPNTSCGSTLQGSSGGAPNLASTGSQQVIEVVRQSSR